MKRTVPVVLALGLICLYAGGNAALAGKDEVKASILSQRLLVEGRRTPAILRLQHEGGFPVMVEELEIVHTKPIHLLAVDPALTDYHHEHPQPTNRPGEYIFTLTPQTPCGYRIWTEIDTKSGERQYVNAEMAGAEDCSDKGVDRTESLEHKAGNLRFTMALEPKELSAGQEATVTVTVREGKSGYVSDLEPYLGAFAHLVGFYDDYRTIAHVHPLGEEPASATDRGGPRLKFHFTPEREGFVKFFMQVKIGGHVIAAPFGVMVGGATPVAAATEAAGTPDAASAHVHDPHHGNADIMDNLDAIQAELKNRAEGGGTQAEPLPESTPEPQSDTSRQKMIETLRALEGRSLAPPGEDAGGMGAAAPEAAAPEPAPAPAPAAAEEGYPY